MCLESEMQLRCKHNICQLSLQEGKSVCVLKIYGNNSATEMACGRFLNTTIGTELMFVKLFPRLMPTVLSLHLSQRKEGMQGSLFQIEYKVKGVPRTPLCGVLVPGCPFACVRERM